MIFLAYKDKYVYLPEKNFATWSYDHWYVYVLGFIVICTIAYLLYKRATRLHNITLYVDKTPTIVQVQHRTTFSAPIPDGKGTFKGWYRDSACTLPFNSSDKILSDFSLYAKFE